MPASRPLLLALALALGGVPAFADPAPEAASGWTAKQAVHSREYMVVAAHPLAVAAGQAMLARGGSAVDAAIATQLVLNLVEPQSSGLGGGAFLLHWDAGRQALSTLDGRETAPAAVDERLFLDADGQPLGFMAAVIGGRSVGVPGTPRLLEAAHRRWGRLPWAELFAPAIRLAREGFIVTPRLAGAIVAAGDFGNAAAQAYFHHADGTPLRAGERLVNPPLAATLERLAAQGADAYYHGEIAADIVRTVQEAANPGRLSAADLAAYTVRERAPVCAPYRRWRVCGMGAPSSGGITLLQMLGMLEHFPPDDGSVDAVHRYTEAGRLAYADRNRYIADPEFVSVPLAGLLDPAYLAARAALIRPEHSQGTATAGTPPGAPAAASGRAADLPSTSQISIVDREGNAVSMTTTIENGFGSRLLVDGFLLNNELTDFSFVPSVEGVAVANRVEAGKRPRSSMAPTLVFDADGRLSLVLGSPGGSAIINYVAKTLLGVLDRGLDMQQAIDLPNLGSRNGPTELEAGRGLEALGEALRARGHTVRFVEFNSGTHAIRRVGDGWEGGADPRREGIAAGE